MPSSNYFNGWYTNTSGVLSTKENDMIMDVEKLEKKIDAMTTICAKGRAEIKQLFEEGFGVEFKNTEKLKVIIGDILTGGGPISPTDLYIVCMTDYKGRYLLINLKTGSRCCDSSQTLNLEDLTDSRDVSEWRKIKVDIKEVA